MIMLWKWGFRVPFAVVAIVSLALSVAGVADWSLGASGMAFGAVVAERNVAEDGQRLMHATEMQDGSDIRAFLAITVFRSVGQRQSCRRR